VRLGVCCRSSLEGCVSTFGRVVVCQPSIVCPLGWEIRLYSQSNYDANVNEP
jgi:hypothetical protein